MSPRINEEPGLPAWKHAQRVEAVLSLREAVQRGYLHELKPVYIQTLRRGARSPHILGQNPTGTSYGRSFRSLEYRRRVGLGVGVGVGRDPRHGLLRVALCALLVWALCAWMFWNANFARP